MESLESMELFESAEFLELEGILEFHTTKDIHSILVFDKNGDIAMMLPIMANKVTLGKDLFSTGDYKLGFNFQNYKEVTLVDLTMM